MSLVDANESDVREEIAAPFLEALGYRRGTESDILREFSLSYDRLFLGRKKKNDPPLKGRPDYVLTVAGSARWVLEVKAPSEAITLDVIEQAISYTRVPQISATYAVILNGARVLVFHYSQKSTDDPIVDLQVESAEKLAAQLSSLLSPSAIRRDCSPPIVDLALPLARGFRSSARVVNGSVTYSDYAWSSNVPLPEAAQKSLNEAGKVMLGLRATAVGGRVWRDDSTRVKCKLEWAFPHDGVLRFAEDKKLTNVEYVSLDTTISDDPSHLTVFDVVGDLSVVAGEPIFSIARWETKVADIAANMNYRGQAFGHITDRNFAGQVEVEYEQTFPAVPGLRINMFLIGRFDITLDPN
ncbi:MAG: hypothetical protein QOF14_2569 [Hyphomicrobiales bacterium]|jgi:hypothetical protein|nr:hypothetical protein [Hyphomicrobiales bacterium]